MAEDANLMTSPALMETEPPEIAPYTNRFEDESLTPQWETVTEPFIAGKVISELLLVDPPDAVLKDMLWLE
jgi:hypothetical protein